MDLGPNTVRFTFAKHVDFREVCDTLHLSIIAVTSLHGQVAKAIDSATWCDEAERTILVREGGPAGRSLVLIFAGYCIVEYGDGAFSVDRPLAGIPDSIAS